MVDGSTSTKGKRTFKKFTSAMQMSTHVIAVIIRLSTLKSSVTFHTLVKQKPDGLPISI